MPENISEGNTEPSEHPKTKEKSLKYLIKELCRNYEDSGEISNYLYFRNNMLKMLQLEDYSFSIMDQKLLKALVSMYSALTTISDPTNPVLIAQPLLSFHHSPLRFAIIVQQALIRHQAEKLNWNLDLLKISEEITSKESHVSTLVQQQIRKLQELNSKALSKRYTESQNVKEKIETLFYKIEFMKERQRLLKEQVRARNIKSTNATTAEDLEALINRIKILDATRNDTNKQIEEHSMSGKLPPSIPDSLQIIASRKAYLNTLQNQITELQQKQLFYDSFNQSTTE